MLVTTTRSTTTAVASSSKPVHSKQRPRPPSSLQRGSTLKPMLLGKSYNAPADDAVFLHIHAIPRPSGSARDVTAVPDRREQLAMLQQLVDDSKHLPQPFRQYLTQLLDRPTQPDLKKLIRQHPLTAGASLSTTSGVRAGLTPQGALGTIKFGANFCTPNYS